VPANLEAALLTPEPYVFRFTMAEPFVPAIREMANPTWAIVPAKVLEEHTSLSQMAIGSGPFMLEQFRGSERIALRRHPEYFHTGKPYLEGITYVVIPENSSLLQAFKAGQHDINGSVLTKDQFEELSADDRFITGRQPSLFYPVIHMKVRREPFDDVRVRKAINIALDRDEILQFIFDGEGNYNGPVQWPQVNWSLPQEELRQFYRYDPDQARSLLEEAGYGGGFSVRCKLPKLTGPNIIGDLAVVCRDQLRRVGIDMQLDEIELGAFITSVILPGNFEMAFFPNLPYDEPDRPLAFYHSKGVTGTGNWTNYANPEVDALIEEQAREFDRERRQEIIWEVQRKILEEHGPQLTLVGGYQYSARWNYVHFGWEQGQPPSEGTAPFAAEIWTSKV
jgi:peptide/nickel transport system substrate-binding protein